MGVGTEEPDVTQMLQRLESGESAVAADLLPIVYDELRAIAARQMAAERAGHTLEATALVNEAWLRLVDQTRVHWAGRTHFFSIASLAMRRVLVDHARSRARLKRGGGARQLPLTPGVEIDPADGIDLLELDEALTRLAEDHPDHARLVELRYFAGMSMDDAAVLLGVSSRTAERWWRFAKAWLYANLGGRDESGSSA
ncbi:MAG: sigma-70 family RNA polymerase sigma factor [Phycisphaerales bacterium]